LAAQPFAAKAQPAASTRVVEAPPIALSRQRAYCDDQLRRLKQASGLSDGQSDPAFMKTCLADVNPVAVLPGPASVMNAPAGSTGVCNDGSYSTAVRKDRPCMAHGGLARWYGG